MKITDTSDVWWKTAVVYCLDVETFLDWGGNGKGDIVGLIQRIDYLAEIGVTCLWLMPFYPTPDRDDGYDITDFYGVDERVGTHGDFVELVRTARDRGIRVIVDLVVNHTSDQHPWFRSARSSRTSRYRDWYVWADDPPKTPAKDVVFPDQETSMWQWDEKAGQHYLHRFYKHQPDLNVANPAVRDEIAKIMGFWLELGVSGFRVDAVPFLIETTKGVAGPAPLPDPHAFLRELRAFLGRRSGDAILLGEVNLSHAQQRRFAGDEDGDELTMLFDFIGMQRLYLSLARRDARPLAKALLDRPQLPRDSQWATFVRNHDELTLDKLTERQRQEVFDAFGPDPDMQIYGRGLRRRLPTDARRRSPPDPDGVQPLVLAPGHARAVLRGGDRDGRGALRRGALSRQNDDAVVTRSQRRLLHRAPVATGRTHRPGWVRAGPRQRPGPTTGSGLAAQLREAAQPALPRGARARVGRAGGPRAAAPGGARPPAQPRRRQHGRAAQPRFDRVRRPAAAR